MSGLIRVADKSNGITAVPQLLRALDLAGCIVTTDAMGCQKKIAREIIESDADHVLALKANRETVHEEVKAFPDDEVARQAGPPPRLFARDPEPPVTFASLETCDKGHGRLETRRYCQSVDPAWFAELEEWEGLKSVGMVESIRETAGKITVERRYCLSSLSLDIDAFARAVRGQWMTCRKSARRWAPSRCIRTGPRLATGGARPSNRPSAAGRWGILAAPFVPRPSGWRRRHRFARSSRHFGRARSGAIVGGQPEKS